MLGSELSHDKAMDNSKSVSTATTSTTDPGKSTAAIFSIDMILKGQDKSDKLDIRRLNRLMPLQIDGGVNHLDFYQRFGRFIPKPPLDFSSLKLPLPPKSLSINRENQFNEGKIFSYFWQLLIVLLGVSDRSEQ